MLFEEKLEKMRAVGKLVRNLLQELKELAKPGVKTIELDKYAEKYTKIHNCSAPCLGYQSHFAPSPFPARICTSPNHTICHGIPGEYILKEGDILSIDLVLFKDGFNGDSCITVPIGKIKPEYSYLLELTENAMKAGINAVKADGCITDIGYAIETYVKNMSSKKNKKFGIITEYGGHGISETIHEEPFVSNVKNDMKCKIKPGMFFTIEPMVTIGSNKTRTLNDGWTVITADYSYCAHFEHTLAVKEDGQVEILT